MTEVTEVTEMTEVNEVHIFGDWLPITNDSLWHDESVRNSIAECIKEKVRMFIQDSLYKEIKGEFVFKTADDSDPFNVHHTIGYKARCEKINKTEESE